MDFGLSDEQRLIVEVTREFTENELFPYEEEVERSGRVPPELVEQIRSRSIAAGIYAANMPAEYGGAGLDPLTLALVERELGAASYALQYIVARPSNILQACRGNQIERYLLPTVRGERVDCLAMSEPDAGSDLRGMKCTAARDGDGYVINGTKHFISHADLADYVILFAATGEESGPRGTRKKITAFLVDMGTPGYKVRPGYRAVSNRGYHNFVLNFDDCRVPGSAILGEEHQGFDVANEWLGATPAAGGGGLPRTGPTRHRAGHRMGGRPHPIRKADRQVPGSVIQTGGHADPLRGSRIAHPQGGLEGRARHYDRHGRGHGQVARQRDVPVRHR